LSKRIDRVLVKELDINVYILRPFNNNKEVGGTFDLETRWKRVIICVYVSYDKPFFEKEFFPRFENNKNNYLYFESFEFIFPIYYLFHNIISYPYIKYSYLLLLVSRNLY